MRQFFLLLIAVSMLAGCSGLQKSSTGQTSSSWLDRTTGMLRNWGAAERKDAYDKEVERLFAQPYIDPLTRYLEQYRNDESRASHLHQVLVERNKRCTAIAGRYATRPLTQQTLDQYRAGYSYSCPAEVDALAERLAKAKAAVEATPPASASDTATGETAPAASEAATSNASKSSSTSTDSSASATATAKSADGQIWGGRYAEQLNDCYLLTTIRNFGEAAHACRIPAEQGDLRAQYNMAQISRSLQQYSEALSWAKIASERSADARFLLGQLYASGQGVEQSDAQALHWYRKAAELGHTGAQFQIGRYLSSGRGVAQDQKTARLWYQRAAVQGYAEAQLALGMMLLQGQGGARDLGQGRYWLLRAARQGQAQAQLQLGDLAQQGAQDGTSGGDQAEAWVWYDLAAQNGLSEGRKRADSIRQTLTPEALQAAQLRVRQTLEGGR